MVALAGCGGSHAPPRVVSWVDAPLPLYHVPPAHLVHYATDAPPCDAAHLRLRRGRGGAATGHVFQELVLTNTGSSTCLVRGYPTLTALDPHGSRVTLRPHKGPTFFGQLVTADAAPGSHVFVYLETVDICTKPTTHYRDLALVIPSGTVHSHASIAVDCGLGMTRVGRPERYVQPHATLAARLVLPRTAARGELLRFTVVLRNPTSRPVPLDPCPGYTLGLFTARAQTRASYRLDCKQVTTLAPHAHQRYAMQLRVPARASGYAKVAWSLDTPGGPFTGGVVHVS